jgi:TetR/AcrR family transcriptional repressor of mexCD-oprJ operon
VVGVRQVPSSGMRLQVSPSDKLEQDSKVPEPATRSADLRPRQALHQRVAAAILEAAAQIFAHRGDDANLGDVADAAGVARATVYRYFPNRRRLLDELARTAAEDAHERLTSARIDEVPVEEGLSRAVRAFVDLGDAFVVLVRERDRSEAREFERLVAVPIRRLLEAGRSAGRIRQDIPTAWLAESLFGLVASVRRQGSLGRDDTVAAIAAVFLQGAATPGAR